MEVHSLQEVAVHEPELKLPPLRPYIGIVACYSSHSGSPPFWWSTAFYDTADAAYIAAASTADDSPPVPSTIRVFRIPEKPWTIGTIADIIDDIVKNANPEFETLRSVCWSLIHRLGVLPEAKP